MTVTFLPHVSSLNFVVLEIISSLQFLKGNIDDPFEQYSLV